MAFGLQPAEIDVLVEFVVERILAPETSSQRVVRDLVMRMAQDFPQAPALTPVLVLSIAANGLDETLADTTGRPSPAFNLWRMAALVANDVMAMQNNEPDVHLPGQSAGASVADLAAYWLSVDDFFLD